MDLRSKRHSYSWFVRTAFGPLDELVARSRNHTRFTMDTSSARRSMSILSRGCSTDIETRP